MNPTYYSNGMTDKLFLDITLMVVVVGIVGVMIGIDSIRDKRSKDALSN
jgi:hypothetical protein